MAASVSLPTSPPVRSQNTVVGPNEPDVGEDGSVPAGVTWEEAAQERQQELHDMLSDRLWNSLKDSEREYLLRIIGHALYGPPDEEPSCTNENTGYKKEKLEDVKKVCHTIQQRDQHTDKTDETYMAVVFVILKIEIEGKTFAIPEPVFRVPKQSPTGGVHVFIDRNNRVYDGWEKYLQNNKLQECNYCYPVLGVYRHDRYDDVLVAFGTTPAGSIARKVLNHVDTAGTIVSVGAALVGLASLATIPVAAPILLASAVGGGVVGLYGAGRSAEVLVDRGMHGQSVGLADAEARNSWIGIAGSTFGLAAAGATTAAATLARNGEVLGSAGRFVVNAMQFSSLTVNGIGIVSGAINLHEKYMHDNLTPLDIFQFSSSVLFFTNSAMNLKTASTIIRENQKNVQRDFRANLRSNRHRKAFDKVARNTRRGNEPMVGDAKVIKGIRNINNPDDFFSGVVRIQKHHKETDAKMTFTDTDQVGINGKMKVEPTKFADVNKDQRQEILDASKKFKDGPVSSKTIDKNVTPIYKDVGLDVSASQPTQYTVLDICKALDVSTLRDVDAARSSYLPGLNSSEIQRLGALFIGELGPKIWPIVKTLISRIDVRVSEFMDFVEFSFQYVNEILSEMEATYQMLLEIAMSNAGYARDEFDRDNGIVGDRTDHFLRLIKQMWLVGQKLSEFMENYQQYRVNRASYEDVSANVDNYVDHRGSSSSEDSRIFSEGSSNSENYQQYRVNRAPEDVSATDDNCMDHRGSPSSEDSNSGDDEDDDPLTYSINTQPDSQPDNISQSDMPNNLDQPGPSHIGNPGPSAHYYQHRDFTVHGFLTDQEHYAIAKELTCMHVDAHVAVVKRRDEESFVIFLECDIVVTIHSDVLNSRVTANLNDGK